MGEVYRARDTMLARDVAIKVLPRMYASDRERLARFQREARVLASLNHPNIATIHGIEASGDRTALVLELIDGETLADRVARGPVPLKEALGIAQQLTDAVDVAHEKGIIHRDLKPANIKITPGGVVKVLDFGLAKLAAQDASSSELSQSPTVTVGRTHTDVLLGTAGYMSPEQARAQAVDKRTDIWAFGCVLFEMLTGRAAFAGATVSDTIARILERQPDWSALPPGTPLVVWRLLKRCLDKDPKSRLRDIADARSDLSEGQNPGGAEGQGQARVNDVRFLLAILASVLVLAVVLAWSWTHCTKASIEATTVRLQVSAPDGTQFVTDSDGQLSPDATQMVFVAARSGQNTLWVHGGGAVWSPDGQRISYTRSIRESGSPNVFTVRTNGTEQPQALTDSGDTHQVWDWSPDGRFLVYSETVNDVSSQNRFDLWVLSLADRKTIPVLRTRFDETRAQFSPDGRWLAYTSDESSRAELYVQPFPVDGRKCPVSSKGGDYVRWRKDGHELFYIASDGTLTAVTVQQSADSLEFGPPRSLFKMPGSAFNGNYPYDVADDGQRFLTLVPVGDADTPPPKVVVMNWWAELPK